MTVPNYDTLLPAIIIFTWPPLSSLSSSIVDSDSFQSKSLTLIRRYFTHESITPFPWITKHHSFQFTTGIFTYPPNNRKKKDSFKGENEWKDWKVYNQTGIAFSKKRLLEKSDNQINYWFDQVNRHYCYFINTILSLCWCIQ